MKGQLSAEMLIILSVVLAVALLLASQMMKGTTDISSAVENNTQKMIGETSKGVVGDPCDVGANNCTRGLVCNTNTHLCATP